MKEYTYEVVMLGMRRTIEGDTPRDAIATLAESMGYRLTNFRVADESSCNAMASLIAHNGQKAAKRSVSYYSVALERTQVLQVTESPTIDHGKVVTSKLFYVSKGQTGFILQCHPSSYQGHEFFEWNLCDMDGTRRSWFREYSATPSSPLSVLQEQYKFRRYTKRYNIFTMSSACVAMQGVLRIRNESGKKKDAFRCTGPASIPESLRNSVRVDGNFVLLRTLSGVDRVPLSERPVIAFERIDPAKVENTANLGCSADGVYWNVWWKKNADSTLIEKDGLFYTIEECYDAQLVTPIVPTFLGSVKGKLKRDVDGDGWLYKVSGKSDPLCAKDYKGFWVKYGEGDFNFLEIGTPSVSAYSVCDAFGNKFGTLDQYYMSLGLQLD